MPDRDHWFQEKAPYARRARRRWQLWPKRKPSVLKEDLLDLPLGSDRDEQPDTEEPSEDATIRIKGEGRLKRLLKWVAGRPRDLMLLRSDRRPMDECVQPWTARHRKSAARKASKALSKSLTVRASNSGTLFPSLTIHASATR